jgi:glycosyltransferase involved in cell wall biosynthesis
MASMEPDPKVSIGIPVFNGANFIRAAIDSILAQTFKNFELVICDNASTDRTEEICREYASKDSRVRYFRNPKNIGSGPNHNRAFELSSGEYFRWCSHDDVLAPTFLEKCVAALDNDPDAIAAQPIVGCIDGDGTLVSVCDTERLRRATAPRASDRFAALGKDPRPCYEVYSLIRRNVLTRTGLIAPYPWSDVTLISELSLIGRFVFVPDMLSFNRDHPDRFSRSVLLDRGASWIWWCGPDTETPSVFRFYRRCPNWQIEINLARAIRKHVREPAERHRTYFRLYRHIISPRLLCLLIAEPITALHPRIFERALQLKRWFERRGDRTIARRT